MLKYLNHASVLTCTHGGKVQLMPPAYRSFYVQGTPVLTERDLMAALIVGCPQVGVGIKPCTKVTQILLGRARDIRVDGDTPILENLLALTDGAPPGTCSAVSNPTSNAQIANLFLGLPQIQTLLAAKKSGKPFCEICEKMKRGL